MARTVYGFTVTRSYRLDAATAELLTRIVDADGSSETEAYRRLIRQEAERRGYMAAQPVENSPETHPPTP